jgi:hypothetical protein
MGRRRDRFNFVEFFVDRISNDWRALLWLAGIVVLFTALIVLAVRG